MTATAEVAWAGGIDANARYPDLAAVAELYPGANPNRPSLDAYREALGLAGRLTPAVDEAIAKAAEITDRTAAVIYVAGPLTGVSDELKARYGMASDLLTDYPPLDDGQATFFGYVPHLHGTDPVKHPSVTADEVRDIDFIWGRLVPTITINFTYPTAHGNAIEEGWGEAAMVPAEYLNPRGNKLSRLTLGMNNVLQTIEYDDFETDGLTALKSAFDEIHAWMKTFPDRDPREFFYLSYNNLRTPLLLQHGLDPTAFNPVFPVSQTMVYIGDPESPHYGRAGDLLWHDWKDSGFMGIKLSDGEAIELHDESPGYSFWHKPPPAQTAESVLAP